MSDIKGTAVTSLVAIGSQLSNKADVANTWCSLFTLEMTKDTQVYYPHTMAGDKAMYSRFDCSSTSLAQPEDVDHSL